MWLPEIWNNFALTCLPKFYFKEKHQTYLIFILSLKLRVKGLVILLKLVIDYNKTVSIHFALTKCVHRNLYLIGCIDVNKT